jgi:anti-sigma B factor antagonist
MLDSQTQYRKRSPRAAPTRWRCLRSGDDDVVRVAITGELDLATAPQLDRALRRAQADAPLVVLDLRRLAFADCSGAHVLLAAERRAHAAGDRLAVVRGPAEVDKLLALTGVDAALWLVDDPSAVAALPPQTTAASVGSPT